MVFKGGKVYKLASEQASEQAGGWAHELSSGQAARGKLSAIRGECPSL
jgi:hypothetical protein